MKPPCVQKYTLGLGSGATGLGALPAHSRMDSYTSTTLKEDPHATCLPGCIIVNVTAQKQFTIHVVILLHLLCPKLGMVLDDAIPCGEIVESKFELNLNLNSNASWG